jgi:hypothetical protein
LENCADAVSHTAHRHHVIERRRMKSRTDT